jgi:GTP-binding protein Era
MHSGYVAITGKPNVGKSTLLNTLCKHKVAITSPKPQTTRNQIHAVYEAKDLKIQFIDTPG